MAGIMRYVVAVGLLAAAGLGWGVSGPDLVRDAAGMLGGAALGWPAGNDVTVGNYHYLFEQQLIGSENQVGQRLSIEFTVGAEHAGQYAVATMADGPRTREDYTLQIIQETHDPASGTWKRSRSVGWTGGPTAVFPGIGIEAVDIGKRVRWILDTPFGFGADLRRGTVEELE